MRLMLAGLFVFAGLLGAVALVGFFGLFQAAPAPIIGIGGVFVMLALIGMALVLFNRRGTSLLGSKSFEDQVRELEEMDLLVSQSFVATRAFAVEEFEDEGVHYFLELVDGTVLFLSGQYLYDYEPVSGTSRSESRRFPCTEFIVRRHRHEHYAVDIQCAGKVLEPEVTAPPFGEAAWREEAVPEDGTLITDQSYEEIKRHRVVAA